jgi:hypothetical protein
MPLEIPKIDDRDYQQILNEALVRIPVHNPEWTNFNDSDPGITLVQLFAFMTENLLYRSNLIPERNRIKFLKLLGIPVEPAAAAKGIVTFSNLKGALKTGTLPRDLEVTAGQVPFRTKDGIDALPMEAKVYYKKTVAKEQISKESNNLYLQLYSGFQEENKKTETKFYETRQLEAPASGVDFSSVDLGNPGENLDGSLWVALLAPKKDLVDQTREEIATKVLTLGFLPALTEAEGQVLPAGPISTEDQPEFTFHMPIGEKFAAQQKRRTPHYRLLEAKPSGKLLSEPGVVHLTLPGKDDLKLWENLEPLEAGTGDFPPSLEETDVQERLITWVRIRVSGLSQNQNQSAGNKSSSQLKARLSWVGINAARVEQYAHISSENLGPGTGEPDQTVTLANTPVISTSVKLTVNGETWQRIDDLMTADSEIPVRDPRWLPTAPLPSSDREKSKVFTVDRESGEIRFGDGLHGVRPPVNAVIRAGYDYGGGTQGNVGIGSINKGPALTNGIKVTNEIPTWGGDEAESTVEAEKQIPAFLRHRDRLVSAEDFKVISQRTPGIELARVEVLPLFHPAPELQNILSQGVVTLMVIPKNDSLHPNSPEPDRLFLDTICDYLNSRRLVTTELHVRGPAYVPVWVSVGIDVVPGMDVPPVREAVKEAIKKFLSPLTGGFEEEGWPLEKTVEKLEIWARATQVPGVSKVNSVLLAQGDSPEAERVEMTGLQLPRIMGLSIETGEPKALDRVRADAGSPEPGEEIQPEEIFPVPVVPSECK